MADDKDLEAQGKEDSRKGKLGEAAGKVEKNLGKMFGKKDTQAKGTAREIGGKAQGKGGDIERKVDETLRED